LLLTLEGERPAFLSSAIRDDNDQLTVAFTNAGLHQNNREYLPLGSLHLGLKKFLWEGACYQELRIENHSSQVANISVAIEFGADFADIYEVRGMKRKRRGEDLAPEVSDGVSTLSYRGLDGIVRRTVLKFTPLPDLLTADRARFKIELLPRQAQIFRSVILCEQQSEPGVSSKPLLLFHQARSAARASVVKRKERACRVESPNGQFTVWVQRAASDLGMITTVLPTGPYPYAGVPWFNTPFGRDGIITSLECMWLQPTLARGVLAYLASTQATEIISEQDAEPGKILHETRNGEMATLREMPFARYYGSVDATPLFVQLAGAYYERTGDLQFVREIWPNIEAALLWMGQYGDSDGDGFLEYSRKSGDGLVHQGWKDSENVIYHANGSPARGPLALCEVQAYAYAAWRAAALLAAALDRREQVRDLNSRAELLQTNFERAFWCDDLSTYALALDGNKQPCRVRTSNAGQCLSSGIASLVCARRVCRSLMSPEGFSGWGIRSVSASEACYNPMSYHNGGVWPHDNALIASGFARYGMSAETSRVFKGIFDAALHFELLRVLELFCGFPREEGEGPILYPAACAPQAWSAASVFLLFQACLGLTVNGVESKITFFRPLLPPFIDEARILDLQVGAAILDLSLIRNGNDVIVRVVRSEGDAQVVSSR